MECRRRSRIELQEIEADAQKADDPNAEITKQADESGVIYSHVAGAASVLSAKTGANKDNERL
jgi:hypothetical protein